MKKRIISILLCLCLALALVPTVPVQAEDEETSSSSVITITAQPETVITTSSTATFSVTATAASGYTLTYNWESKMYYHSSGTTSFQDAGCTTAEYTVSFFMSSSSGVAFRCAITAWSGNTEVETVYSDVAYLYYGDATHEHSWSDTYTCAETDGTSNAEYHWHVCTADCYIPSGMYEAMSGYESHTMTSWAYDDSLHWKVCSKCDYEATSAGKHSYGDPVFTWAEDYSSATATFTCECGKSVSVDCGVGYDITDPTSTTDGKVVYTIDLTYNGKSYVEKKTVITHNYGETQYTWVEADGGYTCTASRTCTVCDETETAQGTVIGTQTTAPTCTTTGVMTYTATFGDCDWAEEQTKTAKIAATGHSYGAPVFAWAEDYATATAAFTCEACSDVQTVKCGVTSGTTEAKCTVDGENVYTATVTFNEQEYTETKTVTIAATGHDWGEPEWKWNEDCTAVTATFTCATCGTTEDVVVSGDAISVVREETCTQAGVYRCSTTITFAGTEYSFSGYGSVAATGHSYGDTQYTWAEDYSTCTASRTCTVCNDTETAQGTVSGEQTTDPTCTEKGEMTYTATFDNCDWADERIATEEIAPTGHSYGEPVFAWAEDYSAAATFTCEACGDVHTEDCQVRSVTTAASCTVAGETVYTAAVTFEGTEYTETQTVAIPATGHSWGEWETVASPTCEDEGSERRVCAVCGLTETQGLDPTGHNWDTEYTIDQAATCTTDGSQSIHCQDCDAVTDSQVIPATGHVTETQNAQAATCTQDGYTGDQVCTVCGETISEGQVIPATDHSYEETVVAPTYTEEGYTLHTCTVCGESYTTDPTPVLTLVIGETDEEEVKVVTRTSTQELTEVPETLTEVYATVEELEVVLVEELAAEVASRVSVSVSYDEENVTVHDVTLQYQINDGEWIDATEENFPATGITVILPYPAGTDSSYDFVVAHMFTVTSETLGTVAGEVEYPAVTKTEDGLMVTLRGLSPVAIAWTEAETTETAEATATPAAAATAATTAAPNTGDDAATALWLAILTLSACGLTGIVVVKKKKAQR